MNVHSKIKLPSEIEYFPWSVRYREANNRNISNIIEVIDENTSVDDFEKMCYKVSVYKLNIVPSYTNTFKPKYGIQTALGRAAATGNLSLIDYMVRKAGKELLFLCDEEGRIPLHQTVLCKDLDKGLLAARKLIQLGTPIDMKTYLGNMKGINLLELAIMNSSKNIVILCLRLGMKEFKMEKTQYTLKKRTFIQYCRNRMMYKNEKLFSLSQQEANILPKDVIDYILLISSKLV